MPVPFESRTALEVARVLGNSEIAGRALDTPAQLDVLLAPWPYSGRRDHDAAEARAVAGLRHQLITLWDAERDATADLANAILVTHGTAPQLVRHDGTDWHLHAVAPDQPLAARIAVETAMAFVDLVRAGETDRCRRCADQTCLHLFFDESRNRSRRFCSTQCQARVNVAAYRARRT
ncbi:CGNR zinc finger domain-containing protein [Microlunatus sp. Gsoil 973]|uniref:CGNR zinc finger domain-containing protein n=1 Tax=Microlunatus sp. Gsoil 973 TaxID=2672569 RepID=UPI0012B487C3|nr:CGNR zinc finger domain-containing protein [Microlunatus sp. Gsoil 973]QGN31937.1 RNA-binding protein [Microlunatus sp. Gsoil 973]